MAKKIRIAGMRAKARTGMKYKGYTSDRGGIRL